MTARIQTRLFDGGVLVPGAPTLLEQSRDDLRYGYDVECYSFVAATTYQWSLAFTPDSAGSSGADPFAGTPSTAVWNPVAANTRTAFFNVDWDGSYLVRLVVDAGLPTEDVQFIRCRSLTRFGDLKLVAAGERRDNTGVIPVDANLEGWTDDANQNLLRLAAFVRRNATSGRVLYVDSNRGRDSTASASDPTNIIEFPGYEAATWEETGIKAKAEGFGDFPDITSALSYASQAAARGEPVSSLTDPYVILVKPGIYLENLTLVPFVYVVAEQSLYNPDYGAVTVRAQGGGQYHTFAATAASDYTMLAGLTLDNEDTSVNPVLVHNGGKLDMTWCAVNQRMVAAGHVPAVTVDGSTWDAEAAFTNCTFTTAGTGDTSFAISTEGTVASLRLDHCEARGPSVIKANDPNSGSSTIQVYDTTLSATTGYVISGFPATVQTRNAVLEKTAVPGVEAVVLGPYGGMGLGLEMDFRDTVIKNGDLSFDPTGFLVTKNFKVSNLQMVGGTIVFPSAPGVVPTVTSETLGKSVQYAPAWVKPETTVVAVNVAKQLPAYSAQDAIDFLVNVVLPVNGAPFYSLDTAYDGIASLNPLVMGAGLGRTIIADQGAVKITGATSPIYTETDGLLRGGLQAEGVVDIGPVVGDGLGSEISLNPNLAGAGPFVSLGRVTFPTNGDATKHSGLPAAILQAGRAGGVADASYNATLRTRNRTSSSTGNAGWAVLDGGTVPWGDNVISGGSVFVQGGSNYNPNPAKGDAGDVFLAPGYRVGGPSGTVRVVDPTAATKASLVAGDVFVGGVTGSFWMATPNGIEEFAVLNTDALADVINTVNATSQALLASNSAGKLKLECLMPGPTGAVLFVRATALLNTALGKLSCADVPAAVFTAGTYPDAVTMECTGPEVLSIGTTFPIIMDGTTGKLTVPGIIDPIALVLDANAGTNTELGAPAAGKGTVFVSDGTAPLVDKHLYFRDEDGTYKDLSASGAAYVADEDTLTLDVGTGTFSVKDADPLAVTGLTAAKILGGVYKDNGMSDQGLFDIAAGNVVPGDTCQITFGALSDQVYTFVAGAPAAPGEVQVGGGGAASLTNLHAEILARQPLLRLSLDGDYLDVWADTNSGTALTLQATSATLVAHSPVPNLGRNWENSATFAFRRAVAQVDVDRGKLRVGLPGVSLINAIVLQLTSGTSVIKPFDGKISLGSNNVTIINDGGQTYSAGDVVTLILSANIG